VSRTLFAVLPALSDVSRTRLVVPFVSNAVLHSPRLVSPVPLGVPSTLDAEPAVIGRMLRFPLAVPLVVEALAAVVGTVLLPVSDEPRTLFVRNRTFEQVQQERRSRCSLPSLL
jgi:hypothetical protein